MLWITVPEIFAQAINNHRHSSFQYQGDTLILDSLSIVPESLILFDEENHPLDRTDYYLDPAAAKLWIDEACKGQKMLASYRVFPINFNNIYTRKSPGIFGEPGDLDRTVYRFRDQSYEFDGLFQNDELDKQGSISRGLAFGNNQDLIVNSSLNLQLTGRLSEDLNIDAAISDRNIPVQPEGTSRQIREFDKVYIRVYNETTELTAGDFELQPEPGYFMQFYKKLQGARFTTHSQLGQNNNTELKTKFSGAISKGKYCRMSFTGIEGNQGPYRLMGCENEQYIVVLAGTEKVYIDGVRMRRGLEYDYTIDYNTAELVFTPNRPITKDKRIVVEFEYAEKNYARFMVYSGNQLKTDRGRFWLNVLSEQDSKNQSLQQSLSDEEKEFLSGLGDNLDGALIESGDSVGFENDQVRYTLTDTLVGGTLYEDIYVFSTDPKNAHYQPGFSFVGEGRGNYLPIRSAANGRVYQWVAPVDGIPQGSYAPVKRLVTPKKHQMMTLGADYRLQSGTSLWMEWALTNRDLNTFSSRDREDNMGMGWKLSAGQLLPFTDTSLFKLSLFAGWEGTDDHFRAPERYREVEFERNWNLETASDTLKEHMLRAGLRFEASDKARGIYSFDFLSRPGGYSASRHSTRGRLQTAKNEGHWFASLLQTDKLNRNTLFLRYDLMYLRDFKLLSAGIREEGELNRWKPEGRDSLMSNSFAWYQHGLFLRHGDSARSFSELRYELREDQAPGVYGLKTATTAHNFSLSSLLGHDKLGRIQSSITYRLLEINDTALIDLPEENNLLGKINYNNRFLRGSLTMAAFYQAGSGLERVKEYSYLEVARGQGVYSWTDYNENGIKELDEFELARFPDQAGYIRIFLPGTRYEKIFNTRFSQQITLAPARIWGSREGILKFISRFSNRFAFRMERSDREEELGKNLNPLYLNLGDTSLTSFTSSVRNNFSFNRSSSRFGIDHIYLSTTVKNLLANGAEIRGLQSNALRFRVHILEDLVLMNQAERGLSSLESEFFLNRNYKINHTRNDIELEYQPGTRLKLKLAYRFKKSKNLKESTLVEEQATENNIGLEGQYSISNRGKIRMEAHLINLFYNAEPNTPVAYEMLGGLEPGYNGTWSLLVQHSLGSGIEINLTYDGRVSEEKKVIHTGGMQVRAYF